MRHQAARLTELAARKGWGGAELTAAANDGIDDEERRFSDHEVSVYLSGEDSPIADDLLRLIEATGPKDPLAALAYVLGLADTPDAPASDGDRIVAAADAAFSGYDREGEEHWLLKAQEGVRMASVSVSYYVHAAGGRMTVVDALARAAERRGYLRGRMDARFELWGQFCGAADIDDATERGHEVQA